MASELQQLLDRMRQVARLHNETARRVNAERIERSIGGYTYLEIFEPEAAGGVTLSDGSTISFEQGVKNPLAALLAQCGCMLNDVQVPREDGTTYGTVRADCRIFCQEGLCERPLEDLLAEFDATEACLANALAAIEAQIDTLERENNAIRDSDPRLRLLSLRTSIWENLFAEGIDLPGWVLVPGPPSAADLDVTGFLRDVAQGIYQRNLSVDEAINQAVSKHSEGRPVAAAAYDQLGYYMRVRYRKKLAEALAELGYEASDENIELLMTGEPPDDLRDELNRIEDNNARLGLLRIQAAILREAQLGFLESKQACLRAYYEQCLNSRYCEIHLTQVLFSAYRQLLQNNSYEIAWDERCRLCDRIRQILASSDPDSTLYSELFRQFLDCLRRKECPAGAEPRPCAGGKSGLPQAGGEAR